jgi:hypothetical protein
MIDFSLLLWSGLFMALLTAALGSLFPANHRPWWHARRRAEPAARAGVVVAELDPHLAETQPVTVPFQVVESVDRRDRPLPFVGKDRRRAARAAARQDARRHGNGR